MNKWYKIKNEAEEVDVYIYDEIGSYDISAKSFIDEIKDHKGKTLNIHINSLGGEVFDGMAIANAIKNYKGKTRTYIEGIAASISTVIALSADEVYMAENSLFMIHNAWGGSMGDAKEMRKQAELLDKISNEIARIYTKKSSLPQDKILSMMNEETWLDAKEAKDMGFVDYITEPVKVAAKYDISNFKNITDDKIKSIINQNQIKMAKNEKSLLEDIKALFVKNESINNGSYDDDKKSEMEDDDKMAEVPAEVLKSLEELKSRVDDLESKIDSMSGQVGEKEEENASLKAELVDAKGELETANDTVLALGKELSRVNATGTSVSNDKDPSPIKAETSLDSNSIAMNSLAEAIRSRYVNR